MVIYLDISKTKIYMENNNEILNSPPKKEKIAFNWQAPAYIQYDKPKAWYIVMGVFVLIGIIISMYYNNFIFAVLLIFLSGVYVLQHSTNPEVLDIKITDGGVYVDKTFYQYGEIQAFWFLTEEEHVQTIHFQIVGKKKQEITYLCNAHEIPAMREYLLNYIPEWVGKEERTTDFFIRLFRL